MPAAPPRRTDVGVAAPKERPAPACSRQFAVGPGDQHGRGGEHGRPGEGGGVTAERPGQRGAHPRRQDAVSIIAAATDLTDPTRVPAARATSGK
jgi:hypothetical protein